MNQKLGVAEFEEVLLDNISKTVVNEEFIYSNLDYWDSVVNDLFNYYFYSAQEISIKNLSKVIEVTISNNLIYKMKF